MSLWQEEARRHRPGQRARHPDLERARITPDVDRATQFYGDVLGIGVEKTEMPGGGGYTALTVDGRMIGGAMEPTTEGLPPHWNVYFNVESVDDTVARAEAWAAGCWRRRSTWRGSAGWRSSPTRRAACSR